MFLNNICVYIN